jgi:hypothetical protein
MPLTFTLDNSNNKEELDKFKLFIKNMENAIWILKPGENSNRGKGITVCKQFNQI